MRRRQVLGAMVATAVLGSMAVGATLAQGGRNMPGDRLFGRDLMTEQERLILRERLRNARTGEERERIRAEHHERMRERAEAQGFTLPEEPMAGGGPRSGGMPGQGWGGGRGRGS